MEILHNKKGNIRPYTLQENPRLPAAPPVPCLSTPGAPKEKTVDIRIYINIKPRKERSKGKRGERRLEREFEGILYGGGEHGMDTGSKNGIQKKRSKKKLWGKGGGSKE